MKRVTVLGGSGIFGGRIARALATTAGLEVHVAGRDPVRGEAFARSIGAGFQRVDLADERSLSEGLEGCALLIHAAGPFQGRDYAVASACMKFDTVNTTRRVSFSLASTRSTAPCGSPTTETMRCGAAA